MRRDRSDARSSWRVPIAGAIGVSVLLGSLALGGGLADAGPSPAPTKQLQTPVLSARRLPTVVMASSDQDLIGSLQSYLDKVVGTTCAIVEIDGRVIFRRNTDAVLSPASTIKLATALAAIDVLGADTTLSTRFVATGPIKNGVLDGDLWVVGGGDPLLTTRGYTTTFDDPDQVLSDFGQLADAVRGYGIKRITGSIIGDDSRYDSVRWVSSWPQRYQVGGTVSPLSALVVNDGNTGYTETPDTSTTVRKAGDPPLLFAQTLRTVLSQRGIEVNGEASTGVAPSDARELGSVESMTVSELAAEMLTYSDNTTAELLTKEMGLAASGTGTTAAGVTAIRDSLQRQGFDLTGLVMKDGSGLDTGDRATCPLLLALLERVAERDDLTDSLPVGGKTGTLRKRMLGTPSMNRVRAKTGTLSGVNSLVGFADTTQGATLRFAFMHTGMDGRTTGVADGFGDRLVAYGSKGPKLTAIAPLPAR